MRVMNNGTYTHGFYASANGLLRRTGVWLAGIPITSKGAARNQRKKFSGRVNQDNLFAFNEKKKIEAVEEKGYWDHNKDNTPINRWQYLRWAQQVHEENIFIEKMNTMPVDQKYRMKKMLELPFNPQWIMPAAFFLYIVWAYVRYQVFGTTERDTAINSLKLIHSSPKPWDRQ